MHTFCFKKPQEIAKLAILLQGDWTCAEQLQLCKSTKNIHLLCTHCLAVTSFLTTVDNLIFLIYVHMCVYSLSQYKNDRLQN